jgi:hypothetical protein
MSCGPFCAGFTSDGGVGESCCFLGSAGGVILPSTLCLTCSIFSLSSRMLGVRVVASDLTGSLGGVMLSE